MEPTYFLRSAIDGETFEANQNVIDASHLLKNLFSKLQ